MKISKVVSAILSGVIFLSAISVTVCADKSEDFEGDTAPIAAQELENSALRLKIAEDGELQLTDIKSGHIASSRNAYYKDDFYSLSSYKMLMSSEVAIDYYNVDDAKVSNQNAIAYSSEAEVSVLKEQDCIVASYSFTSYEISFSVIYTLLEDSLEASIDIESIKESGDYRLNKISLLPGLFSGNGNDEGYIFVPDGSGALINFNNKAAVGYSARVYGSDLAIQERLNKSKTEVISMPVFGAVKNDAAMFAIVTSGDAAADISAGTQNSDSWYNFVYSTLNIRSTYEKLMFSADKTDRSRSTAYSKNLLIQGFNKYTVRYYLLPENSGYVEMAEVYRGYLIDEKGLERSVSEPKFNIELIGAIDVKANFLGFSYYKTKSLTSYSEAVDILKKLQELGIEDIRLRYIGWNNNGITNKNVMKSATTMRVLGGKGEFTALNGFAKENNITVDYDIDMLRFYGGSKKYKVSSPFNEAISFSRYLRSVYATDISKRSWYMLSAKYLVDNFETLKKSLGKLGVENISLASLSNTLYSDLKAKNQITRSEMQLEVEKILSGREELNISAQTANAYALPYVSMIYSAPCYTSGYNIFDKEIPFYQIVLHGIVDMTGESQFISDNRSINYLKAVETGTQLLYTGMATASSDIVDTDYDYLYGTDFSLWEDDAVGKHTEYQPLLKRIYDKVITNHLELAPNVYKTVYENGVEVVVNYNNYAVNINGTEIEAYGFYEVA